MALEQKICQQGSFGAKDQLLINKLLTGDCKTRHRSLIMAWVNYQKPMTACHTVGYFNIFSCIRLVQSCAGFCHV